MTEQATEVQDAALVLRELLALEGEGLQCPGVS